MSCVCLAFGHIQRYAKNHSIATQNEQITCTHWDKDESGQELNQRDKDIQRVAVQASGWLITIQEQSSAIRNSR